MSLVSYENEDIGDQGFLSIQKSPYKASWLSQLNTLNKRCFLEMAREPMLLRIKIIQTIMVGLIVGLIFIDVDGDPNVYNQDSVQNINGVLFMLLGNLSFQFAFGVVNTFCSQLPIFLREHLSGMYSTDTFYLTKNFAELPTSIMMPVLFLLVCFFLVNLTRDAGTFFLMSAVLILATNVALSFGYLISCIASDLRMALNIAAPMLIPFMIFGGFYLNQDTCPKYFIWIQYISWFNYGFEGLVISQWRYVTHIDGCEKDISLLCYPTGTEVIKSYGYEEDNLWFDILMLVVLIIFYRTLAFLALLRRSYKRL